MQPVITWKDFIMVQFVRCAVLIAVSLLTQGCTVLLWQDTFTNRLEMPRIIGFISLQQGDSAPSKYIIIHYDQLHHIEKDAFFKFRQLHLAYPFSIGYNYAIPIDNEKFPYFIDNIGNPRTSDEIISAIPKDQLESIGNFRIPKKFHILGESSEMRYISNNREIIYNNDSSNLFTCPLGDGLKINGSNVTMIPYSFGKARAPQLKLPIKEWGNSTVDPQIEFLLVPSKQSRFVSERLKTFVIDVCYTPLTTLEDISMIPISMIALAKSGYALIKD